MKRREFIVSSVVGSVSVGAGMAGTPLAAGLAEGAGEARTAGQAPATPIRKILIAGGGFNTAFIRYMAQLTGKPRPKLLYLPTASADSPTGIISWYKNCATLNVEPSHQVSFIASTQQPRDWDEVLLSVDGIVCSGGNTLNQQVIWKAHGIDIILKQAWDQGIVLGGASAGSLCWFEEGTTDSRPKELSTVQCLGFLAGSHCPHYDAEPGRRPLYHKLIESGQMKPGYACDNDAGIYFEGTEVKRVVHTRAEARVYYVTAMNGKAVERRMPPDLIA